MAILLIAGLTAFTATVLFSSYEDTIDREKTNLHNLSTAFAAQTRDAMHATELILNQVQLDYVRMAQAPGMPVELDYRDYVSTAQEHLLGIYLFDDEDRPIAKSLSRRAAGLDAPPRDAGRSPYANGPSPERSVRIGISDIDRKTGHAVLNFHRDLLDSAGRKAGAIVMQIDSAYFQQIFDSVDLGSGGSVTLLGRDGTMLVRGPSLPDSIGRSFLQTPLFQKYLPNSFHGAFEETSPVDRKRRVYGYNAVSGYPLVIITGMDKSTALEFWIGRLQTAIIFLLLIALTFLFLAWRMGRESLRQTALIDRLANSEARLGKSARYLEDILDTLGTPVWVLDNSYRLLMVNESFRQFIGGRGDDLIGRREAEVLKFDDPHDRTSIYEDVLHGSGVNVMETELRDGNGQLRNVIQLSSKLVNEEATVQIVNALTDITERKEVERRLAYLAEFDLLTELPNQTQFLRILHETIAHAGGKPVRMGVLVIALERMQEVIDVLGHDAGDQVLGQVGDIMRGFLPACRCVARVKSAEFAALIQVDGGAHLVEQFATNICNALSVAFSLSGREFYLGPLIGIALFPQDATSADELLRLADIAKHRAGLEGTEPIVFFSERSHAMLNERLTIEEQLRRALNRQEFRVAYQPKVDVRTGRIVGFEALLRWSNPVLGKVSPASFIPIAESTGLIVAIGAWVMSQACRDAAAWTAHAGAPIKVAVNLSLRQFHQKNLCDMIRRCIDDSGILPCCLELEITESTAMSRAQEVDALFNEIRQMGVELSIDDFGTGYSSLAYLKRFPVQRLKIDRTFIHDLVRDADSAAIVRSIVNLGHGLQLRIVAEGVETEEQLSFLRELSCDEYQGYLFSPAIEGAEVPDLLKANADYMRIKTGSV